MTLLLSGLLFLSHFGCHASLKPLYEREKSQTLRTATAVEDENWTPDARFRFSYDRIAEVGTKKLQTHLKNGQLTIKFLGQEIKISTSSTLQDFSLSKGDNGNIQCTIKVEGDAVLTHPLLSFSQPYSGTVSGTISLDMNGKELTAKINQINSVSIKFEQLPKLEMTKPIEDWINNSITNIPPFTLAELDTSLFFSRDIRFVAKNYSFDIELLTHFPETTPLSENNQKPRGDWELAISTDTFSRIIRTKTFALKPTPNGIYIDAKRVYFTQDNLNIDLRLWKLGGWGQWWRDYDISTPVLIKEKDIILGEPTAKLIEKSPLAELVDPIIILGEGYILKTISEHIRYTLPKTHQKDISGTTLEVNIESIRGNQKSILFYGNLEPLEPDSTKKESEETSPRRNRRSK